MKILHTSDLHIGSKLYSVDLKEDQEYILNDIIRIAKEEAVDLIVVAGDIFDTGNYSGESSKIYNRFIKEAMLRNNLKMTIIAGNHDSGAKLTVYDELLDDIGFYIRGELANPIEPICFDDTVLWPVPHFTLDEARRLYGSSFETQEEAMQAVLDGIHGNMDTDKTNILVLHAYVGGKDSSPDEDKSGSESAEIGGSDRLSPSLFEAFDFVMCGHIHRHYPVQEGKIYYSGSPMQVSFDEKGKKGVYIYDTCTGEVKTVETVPLRKLKYLEMPYSELIKDDTVKEYSNGRYLKIRAINTAIDSSSAYAELKRLYPAAVRIRTDGKADTEDHQVVAVDTEDWSPEDWLTNFFDYINTLIDESSKDKKTDPVEKPELTDELKRMFIDAYNQANETKEEK